MFILTDPDTQTNLEARIKMEVRYTSIDNRYLLVAIPEIRGIQRVIRPRLCNAIIDWQRREERRWTNAMPLINLTLKEDARVAGRPVPPEMHLVFCHIPLL